MCAKSKNWSHVVYTNLPIIFNKLEAMTYSCKNNMENNIRSIKTINKSYDNKSQSFTLLLLMMYHVIWALVLLPKYCRSKTPPVNDQIEFVTKVT